MPGVERPGRPRASARAVTVRAGLASLVVASVFVALGWSLSGGAPSALRSSPGDVRGAEDAVAAPPRALVDGAAGVGAERTRGAEPSATPAQEGAVGARRLDPERAALLHARVREALEAGARARGDAPATAAAAPPRAALRSSPST